MRGSVLPGLRSRALLLALLLLAFPTVLAGQTVSDPTTIEFNASPDHAATFEGLALVSGYVLNISPNGATSVVLSVPLGKPAPDAAGLIRLSFPSSAIGSLTPGVVYESRVAATGPGGSSESGDSNAFTITTPVGCTPAISPASAAVAVGATSGTVTVTVGTGCAWSASSNASWLSVTSGSSGNGNGSVSFSAAANTGTASRNGSLTIAGQAFTVSQPGATPACSYAVSPATRSVTSAATSGTVSVSAGSGCAWTATSNVSWMSVTAGASGSGNGAMTYSVSANNGAARTGTLTIGRQTFTISQAGTCAFNVTPLALAVSASGGATSVSVTTTSGCTWSGTDSVAWIGGGGSGNGNGSVTFTVSANTATAARNTTVVVAGRSIPLTQTGANSSPSAPKNVRIIVNGGQ